MILPRKYRYLENFFNGNFLSKNKAWYCLLNFIQFLIRDFLIKPWIFMKFLIQQKSDLTEIWRNSKEI